MSELKSFEQVVAQLREFAMSLTARQLLLLGGGTLLVAGVLFGFVHLLAKPEMTPLYSNMEPADAQSLEQHLSAKNIRHQLSADGRTVLVSSDQLDAARLEVASSGAAHSGRMGFELFDKTNWATNDFDDRVNYQRALEGELERTIQAMSGVTGVRVHLAIPPDSIYSGQDRPAKAAVILKLREHRIPLAMRQAVQRLVASAVDKLDPLNVTVVDADTGEGVASAYSQPSSEERSADEVLAERLVRTLEPVVGPDHVRATVHAELDPGTMEQSEESYDPDSSVAITMQRSEESNGGTPAGGAAGTPSNVPGGGTPAKPGDRENMAQSKSENGTYAVNKVVRHSTQPAGRLKRIAVAVLVDDICNPADKANPRQKRSPEELKSIEEIAKASVGFDASRGDIVSVQNISFHSMPLDAPEAPTRWQKLSTMLQQWSSYVRIAALLLLFGITYRLVLKPVKQQLIRALNIPAGNKALSAVQHAAPLPDGGEENGSKQVVRLKNEIADRVKQEPVSASRLVQGWIRDGAH